MLIDIPGQRSGEKSPLGRSFQLNKPIWTSPFALPPLPEISWKGDQNIHDFVLDFVSLCPTETGVSTRCWVFRAGKIVAGPNAVGKRKKPRIVNHLDTVLHAASYVATGRF
ncbi:hypothetical protein GCM10011505_13640 [Tistrella bauzanensis]|uniref:Uncharacterized protein n=1 Tax=Tistrella bauzanensis TaxID=657419 RepID=A0ABQ1IEI3_9PROT|nr:hypothetical protein GCM10011505_13640 [Tistrella bauzanensis]